jgi:hypothetical protein
MLPLSRFAPLALLMVLPALPGFAASKIETALADVQAQLQTAQGRLESGERERAALMQSLAGIRSSAEAKKQHSETLARVSETDDALARVLTMSADIKQIVIDNQAYVTRRAAMLARREAAAELARRLQVLIACGHVIEIAFLLLLILGVRRRV